MNTIKELSSAIEKIWYAQGIDVRGADLGTFLAALSVSLSNMEQEPIGEVCGTYQGAYSIGNVFFPKVGAPLPVGTKLYAHPCASGKDAKDTERLNLLIDLGSTWHVQWEQRYGKPARYRMIDDGEPWGKWYDNPRTAIDAAIDQAREVK